MSLGRYFWNDAVFYARHHDGKPRRKPLRTITELAEEFGIARQYLGRLLAQSKLDPPKPAVICRPSATVIGNTYYDPLLMRKWWARHLVAVAEGDAA